MGCSSSKQKKETNQSKNRKRTAEDVAQNVEKVKKETALKSSRQKLNGTARVDDKELDVQIGWNDENTPVQRSITPPIVSDSSVSAPASAPASKRPSTISRNKWTDEELLSQLQLLDPETSSNIVRMFDEGNTIPFMCRYRRELIGNLSADE